MAQLNPSGLGSIRPKLHSLLPVVEPTFLIKKRKEQEQEQEQEQEGEETGKQ